MSIVSAWNTWNMMLYLVMQQLLQWAQQYIFLCPQKLRGASDKNTYQRTQLEHMYGWTAYCYEHESRELSDNSGTIQAQFRSWQYLILSLAGSQNLCQTMIKPSDYCIMLWTLWTLCYAMVLEKLWLQHVQGSINNRCSKDKKCDIWKSRLFCVCSYIVEQCTVQNKELPWNWRGLWWVMLSIRFTGFGWNTIRVSIDRVDLCQTHCKQVPDFFSSAADSK